MRDLLIFWFLLSTVANGIIVNAREATSNEMTQQRKTRATKQTFTKVVNHAFCDSSVSAEDKNGKRTLEEVHTYAELKHDPSASLPDSFTICSTIMTTRCPSSVWPTFFTLLDNDRAQLLASIGNRGSDVSSLEILYLEGATELVTGKIPPLFPNQWIRSCMAINTTSGLIHWVVESTLILTTTSEEVRSTKNGPKDLSKKLVLGARSYGSLWFAPSQKVTNLNIYSSALSVEKMERMTEGGICPEEGDYLAWGDMEWILHGQASLEFVDEGEPCKGEPNVNLYYASHYTMEACMHHCENLGTRVPSVTTSQDWTALQHSLKVNLYNRGLNNMYLWLPVEDRNSEGEWNDFYTGEVIHNYTPPWIVSKPNGGIEQNCAYLLNGDTWDDYTCDYPNFACMCTHKPRRYLEFKGLCPSSAIGHYYKPVGNLTDSRKLNFQGLTQTLISYNDEENAWILDVMDTNVRGVSRATHASFALGKHNWTIKGDKGCNAGKSYVTELKMSGCQAGNFTCNDGQCVSMDQRCNQLPDCRDKSDEINCNILVLEDGYNMHVPPINSSDPVNVSVSMNVLKLVDIDEDDYSIEIQFEITMKWTENRATYHNLKSRDSLNALKQNDYKQLWLPKVIYENTDQKKSTRLGDGNWEWETRIVVRREQEKGTMSGPESVDEIEIFEGSENSLVMNQTYTHTFQCNYKLSYYPFDTQVEPKTCLAFFQNLSFRLAQ